MIVLLGEQNSIPCLELPWKDSSAPANQKAVGRWSNPVPKKTQWPLCQYDSLGVGHAWIDPFWGSFETFAATSHQDSERRRERRKQLKDAK